MPASTVTNFNISTPAAFKLGAPVVPHVTEPGQVTFVPPLVRRRVSVPAVPEAGGLEKPKVVAPVIVAEATLPSSKLRA